MTRWAATVFVALAFSGCSPTESPALSKLATVEGSLTVPAGLGGDAWMFLYHPHEGPPGTPAVPAFVTAVSSRRLETDPRFVFAQVSPNPWRLWGLLDVDGNFDPQIDVLAQPGAGDRIGEGVELNVQPGRTLETSFELGRLVPGEPPAFRLQGPETDVPLSISAGGLTVLTLVSDAVGKLDPHRTNFTFGLLDENQDGRPDDADGDGVPDLSLQLFLRWQPRPGQAPAGTNVIVPMLFNPVPFLSTLNGNLQARVVATQVQVTLVPQATEVTVDDKGQRTLTPFGPPPPGDYELIALTAGGQFWRLPNQLAAALPSQGVRFHFDRVGP